MFKRPSGLTDLPDQVVRSNDMTRGFEFILTRRPGRAFVMAATTSFLTLRMVDSAVELRLLDAW